MRLDELEHVCAEAARALASGDERPVPATVVLPLPAATRVISLPEFPDDDPSRFDLLAGFAGDVMRAEQAPCYGFVCEAAVKADTGETVDALVVVYGATAAPPQVMAAALADDGLGAFTDAEPLDPTAMPFLSPLQHAVDALSDTGGR